MINNLGTPSFELQINFGVLQIDTENSATGIIIPLPKTEEIYLRIYLQKFSAFVYWQLICVASYKLLGHDSEFFFKILCIVSS